MKIEKRCFLQWFVMTLTYGVGAFFAWHYDLPQAIFQADMTYMTSVIAGMFVLAIGYLGFASWRFDDWCRFDRCAEEMAERDSEDALHSAVREARAALRERDRTACADVGLGHYLAAAVIYVGLIGTVIGLMSQLKALGGVNPADPASGTAFLGVTVKSLSTAFYATGCGLVASVLIGAVTQNLTYFLDRSEVSE